MCSSDLRAALLLLGGPAYLGGAAHIGTMWHVACVLSVLEDGARGFRAMHASDELLTGAGNLWTTAAVFTTLDGYAVAMQLAFGMLVVDNRMGLGVGLRVATGAVMAAALWATQIGRASCRERVSSPVYFFKQKTAYEIE